MRHFRRSMFVAAVVAFLTGVDAYAATFTVVNTNDSGAGSLRAAIVSANATPGADQIAFNVAGSPAVINITSGSLPPIMEDVTIDGYTNTISGAAANTDPTISNAVITVEVVGPAAGSGFVVVAGTTTIRGLSILNFNSGITAVGGRLISEGNFIGVRADGLTTLPNSSGIVINSNVANRIGGSTPAARNLLGGNTSQNISSLGQAVIEGNLIGLGRDGSTVTGGGGITLPGSSAVLIGGATAASRNVIAGLTSDAINSTNSNLDVIGNYIGTDATGLAAKPNNGDGIDIVFASADIRNNVISGNTLNGIHITVGAGGTISGNFIGVGSDGLTRVQNNGSGIVLDGVTTNVTVGGLTSADRNIISGNAGRGIHINGASSLMQVINNYIGLAANGLTERRNDQTGVLIDAASSANTIDRNVISGNSLGGIDITNASNGNTVSRNIIGRTADLSLPVGNNAWGVRITGGSNNNQVGGLGLGNTIHDNLGFGVGVGPSAGNANPIRHNSIFGNNGGLGIDLNLDGVTPNDPGDVDAGPNTLQNFPVVTLAARGPTVIQTAGTLNSTPLTTFFIDLFASSAADTSGFGEGQRYIGTALCATDASGNCSWEGATFLATTTSTDVITATATVNSNTSEFSAAVPVTAVGEMNFSAPTYSVNESGPVATITVTRTSGSGFASVGYTTSNGTATAGSDYAASAGFLLYAPGETSKTFTVSISDDAIFEGNETINLTLSNPAEGATLGAQSTAVLTIIENDAAPVFTINDVTVTEGNAGTTNATFTVTLTGTTALSATVNFTTVNGTAVAPADFTATSGTLTFLTPGTQTITVPVRGDTIFESNETFTVVLSAPTNATLGSPSTGNGTITNDDAAPVFTIGNTTVVEGNAGTVNATFTVTLTGSSATTATVNYATADGTAVAPGDYTATSGTLTFLTPGTQTVTVAVNGDTTFEADETFNVVLSAPTNATLGAPSTGTATITNDDATVSDLSGTMTGSSGPYFGGQNVTYTITVSNAGPDTATATVTDTIPAGTTFVSALPTQGTCSGTPAITCSLGSLANGATATVTLTVTLPAPGGTITNSATVSTAGADPILTNNNPSVTIIAAPATAIPTLSEWALIAMLGALAMLGAMKLR